MCPWFGLMLIKEMMRVSVLMRLRAMEMTGIAYVSLFHLMSVTKL